MMEHKYNKGSEWRKWDLHLHTASSYDYEYKAADSDELLVKSLIANNISVVAITDHFVIDKIRIENLRTLVSDIVIFPGVELRTDKGDTNIHVILIFEEKYDLNILSEDFNVFRRNKAKYPENDHRIYWDFNDIIDFASTHQALISIHAGSKTSGIDDKISNTLEHSQAVKTEFSEYIHIFEMGKIQDLDGYRKYVFPQIGEKPMIICSDNHDPRKYILKNNCWIKADTTFEGLRQIVSEPEERVRVQSSNPNEEKLLYNVIEKVRFIDNSSQKRFTTQEIGFNPNLNAIIGGKSSGKSLLMHLIAGAVGNRADSKNYSELLKNIDIEVFYADNTDEKIKPEDSRIVEFLPQLHIEDIVRNKTEINKSKSEKTRHFNTFIEDLIKQDELIKSHFATHKETIKLASAKINENITTWLAFDKDLAQAKKELQPLGDKTAINGEIFRIVGQITTLTQNAGLTDEELQQYNKLTTINKNSLAELTRLESEKADLMKLLNYATADILQHIKQSIRFEANSSASLGLYNKFILELPDVIQPKIDSFIAEIKLEERAIATKIDENQKLIAKNQKLLEPLLNKNKIQLELKTLETSLTVEKAKLATIEEKEAQIGKIKAQRDVVEFITEYANIINSYANLKDGINERVATIWGESNANLTLAANSIFDSSIFVGSMGAPINLKSQLETQFSNCGFNATTYIHSDETHIQNINNIVKKCIADENRFNNFKGEGNIEELLRAILKDCFYIDYDIKKGSDSLQNMSEGKKGIVVLQLYLSLSKADCPILIDQPEDNLDNRTVYRELNDYIKHSKKRRQIIMVSHNANLVVNTDAENVIIANQAGEDGKENKEFRFEYINGSLENTSPLDDTQKGVLYQQGIREHVCEILEGGTDAFKKREDKYHIKN